MIGRTVFEVMHYDPSAAGAAGDCHHIARFRNEHKAARFAVGRTCYGQPATVERCDDVPRRIADRWSYLDTCYA